MSGPAVRKFIHKGKDYAITKPNLFACCEIDGTLKKRITEPASFAELAECMVLAHHIGANYTDVLIYSNHSSLTKWVTDLARFSPDDRHWATNKPYTGNGAELQFEDFKEEETKSYPTIIGALVKQAFCDGESEAQPFLRALSRTWQYHMFFVNSAGCLPDAFDTALEYEHRCRYLGRPSPRYDFFDFYWPYSDVNFDLSFLEVLDLRGQSNAYLQPKGMGLPEISGRLCDRGSTGHIGLKYASGTALVGDELFYFARSLAGINSPTPDERERLGVREAALMECQMVDLEKHFIEQRIEMRRAALYEDQNKNGFFNRLVCQPSFALAVMSGITAIPDRDLSPPHVPRKRAAGGFVSSGYAAPGANEMHFAHNLYEICRILKIGLVISDAGRKVIAKQFAQLEGKSDASADAYIQEWTPIVTPSI